MNRYKENIEQKSESIQIFTSLKKLGFPKWWIEDGWFANLCQAVRSRGTPSPFSSCSLTKCVISKTKNKDYRQELGAPDESATWHFKTWPKLPCPSSESQKTWGSPKFHNNFSPPPGEKNTVVPNKKNAHSLGSSNPIMLFLFGSRMGNPLELPEWVEG